MVLAANVDGRGEGVDEAGNLHRFGPRQWQRWNDYQAWE